MQERTLLGIADRLVHGDFCINMAKLASRPCLDAMHERIESHPRTQL